jgi:hypothetical protein
MDVGRQLLDRLQSAGLNATADWEWSTIPTVTATAKPAASPLSNEMTGAPNDGFSPRLKATDLPLTQDRFLSALNAAGWERLGPTETGNPSGSAWAESGSLDKRGHTEGWKLARGIEAEVRDLANRISSLLRAGWREVIIVTDHGWLLMPFGLPKVELKKHLVDDRWGRCATLKDGAETDSQTFHWYWNPAVAIASPPGVGCYRASTEYSHGGVSLQEMVIPILRAALAEANAESPRVLDAKWTGARCRITLAGHAIGVRVDVRSISSDARTSLLADRQSRDTSGDGKVTVFLEDDADIGRQAEIVLLDASGQVIDSLPTTLGA